MAARSFLGAGDVYIDRQVDGVPQGLVGPIYANKLSIQPNVEKKESTSKGRYDYGQVLESVNLQQPSELALELKEATGDVLTMAFLGSSAAISEASGTMTDQARTIPALGRWMSLGHRNLADSITVETLATGGVVLVEGTDYRLNRPLGLILAIQGGAIDAADTVYVTGAYDGATGTRISGATRTEVRCRILFDGINQADGSQVTVDIFEAVLSADSEFDFLADDFGVVSLTGTLKTPTGRTEPFTVDVQDPVE